MESPYRLITGDCREELRKLPADFAQTCVTSPPYWSLRDYGVPGQLGNENTLDEYIAALAAVFREVKRVLKPDGTLWLNLGDCFAARPKRPNENGGLVGRRGRGDKPSRIYTESGSRPMRSIPDGLKPKDLIGVPWRVAFALQADGWWVRSDIVWAKPNPMPESVRDRPTRAHEFIFLFSRSEKYNYDAAAAQEPRADGRGKKNRRSVWTVPTQPLPDAHFATFPPKLIEPCVLAGCPKGGIVLDCFGGAGTTGVVAVKHGRKYVGIELSAEYNEMAQRRIEAELEQP